jgi:two-component system sensor histidine kinase MprB
MSLRVRIAAIAASAVAVAVVLVSIGAFVAARGELRAEIDHSLTERMTIVQRASDQFGPFLRSPLPPGIFRGGGGPRGNPTFDTLYYQVALPDGSRIIQAGQDLELPVPDETIDEDAVLTDAWVDGVHLRVIAAEIEPVGVVQIARPLTEVDATLSGLAAVLATIGVVGTVLAGLIGLVVARSALKPIDDLTDAAEHVADTQNLEARMTVEGDDEIARLAESFNAMLAALEDSRLQQRRLVRDAGHELRTPLTALRTNIELLSRGDDLSEEERREIIDAVAAEVGELSTLVTEVVDLASDRYNEAPLEVLSLDELVEESVLRAQRRTLQEITVTAEPTQVQGRPAALGRAVDNLLDNAAKYDSSNGRIDVTVAGGRVAVRDHGPGIAELDHDRVFDRFYRSPSSRATAGSGLGLSIVKQIATDHGGRVFVEEADGEGIVVGFELPVWNGRRTRQGPEPLT